jgi:hypothetical protein
MHYYARRLGMYLITILYNAAGPLKKRNFPSTLTRQLPGVKPCPFSLQVVFCVSNISKKPPTVDGPVHQS